MKRLILLNLLSLFAGEGKGYDVTLQDGQAPLLIACVP